MSSLNNIKKPVEAEMVEFETYFGKIMQSDIPLLKVILNYIFRRKGKQMRPLLVFLSAKLNGVISESTYVAATFIELLHTASLLHDDVVDASNERRGALSINALWNSKIAVLAGDYILSKGMLIGVEKKRDDILEIILGAAKKMSEGELLQLQKAQKRNITESDYLSIIHGKTAALISACTACGAQSAINDADTIQIMKEFGENIGIAFQIKDDILDYKNTGITGKPSGNDIKEGKITLPLIYALSKASYLKKQNIVKIVKSTEKTTSEISEVINFVSEYGGLEYANLKMNQYRDKALAVLDVYPESEVKNSLKEFIYYTTERKK
jgi:octaprenyl-diphosphate synthase